MSRTLRWILLAGSVAMAVGALLPWASATPLRGGEPHLVFGFGHGAEGVLVLAAGVALTTALRDAAWVLVVSGLAVLWALLLVASMADGLLDPGVPAIGFGLAQTGALAVAVGAAGIVLDGLRNAAGRLMAWWVR